MANMCISIEKMPRKKSIPQKILMAFFKLNCIDEFARTLLYSEIPSYYRFVNGQFKRRKKGVCVAGNLRSAFTKLSDIVPVFYSEKEIFMQEIQISSAVMSLVAFILSVPETENVII